MIEDKNRKNVKGASVLSKERLTERTKLGSAIQKSDVSAREMIDKLAEYEDLEEQGLLLRLPCKIGDTVWTIVDECEGDNAGCYGTCDNCHNRRLGVEKTKFSIDIIDEIGNWYFLTQSEAEEKLRELEGNNDN